jgi:hypothetical protein
VTAPYTFAKSVPPNDLSYGGNWRVEGERIIGQLTAPDAAGVRLFGASVAGPLRGGPLWV